MIKINNKDVVDVYKANIHIGNPNLLLNEYIKGGENTKVIDNGIQITSENRDTYFYVKYDVNCELYNFIGKTLTFSCYVKGLQDNQYIHFNLEGQQFGEQIKITKNGWNISSFVVPENIPIRAIGSILFDDNKREGFYGNIIEITNCCLTVGYNPNQTYSLATSEFPNGIIVPKFTNNLLIGSKTGYNMTSSDFSANTEFSSEINSDGFFEFTIKSLVVANNQQYRYVFVQNNLAEYFIDGEEYTLSAEVKCTAPCRIKIDSRDTKMTNVKPIQINFPNTNGQWQRLKNTVRLTDLKDNNNSLLLFGFLDSAPINATATVRKICLTKGNNDNKWMPNIDEIMVPVKKIYKDNQLIFEKKQYKVSIIPIDIGTSYIAVSINTSKSIRFDNPKYNELNTAKASTSELIDGKVISMFYMFGNNYRKSFKYIDLSEFDTSDVTDARCIFYQCENLESVNLYNLNINNFKNIEQLFLHCYKLNHIKCKQHIKDWILSNKKSMCFDDTPFENGEGTWEIVD